MELVEVSRNEVYCDSSIVARKFGLKHIYVVAIIKKVIKDLSKIRVGGATPKHKTASAEYRGADYTVYLMNKDFFTLVVMRFKGSNALRWQLEFIAAFNAMEQRLLSKDANANDPAWLKQRENSKQVRLEETDVIKEFVEYAEAQGSKGAKWYYKHITNATYGALDLISQKKPKLRDTMNFYEISELLLAERRARHLLKKYMALGRNYKDIYESVKDDLIAYGQNLQIE